MTSLFDPPQAPVAPTLPVNGAPRLRPYQLEALEKTDAAIEDGFRRVLWVLPTGAGKTVTFVDYAARRGGRFMVVVHREELLQQAAKAIERRTGRLPEIERADECTYADGHVVSTVQTLNKRLAKFPAGAFRTVIHDEAHHTPSVTWRRCIEHFHADPGCVQIGVTATPDRADEKALGQVFDAAPVEYGLIDAINDGWLVRPKQFFVPVTGLDYSGIKTKSGDFSENDLAPILEDNEVELQFADAAFNIAGSRKTIVFATTIKQAVALADMLNGKEVDCARAIYSQPAQGSGIRAIGDDEREWIMKDFRAGRFRFLVNVAILTEGVDVPDVECIVIARPTKSRALYSQMVGRCTRPVCPVDDFGTPEQRRLAIEQSFKPFAEVIDFIGTNGNHKLVTTFDLLGGDYDPIAVEEARKVAETGRAIDVTRVIQFQEQQLQEKRRREAAAAATKARYTKQARDPFDLLDISRGKRRDWDDGATNEQLEWLRKRKIPIPETGLTQNEANRLKWGFIKRVKANLCTPGQFVLLEKHGYADAKEYKFEYAKALIDELAQNGWRRPARSTVKPPAPDFVPPPNEAPF